MKILYDMAYTQPFSNAKTNGGGESAIQLLEALSKKDVDIVAAFDGNRAITEELLEVCNKENIIIDEYSGMEGLSALIEDRNPDVVVLPVCALSYGNLKIEHNIKLVTIIHDLSTIYADRLHIKEETIGFDMLKMSKHMVKRAFFSKIMRKKHFETHVQLFHMTDRQLVFTVSEYSKFAMCWYFGGELDKKIQVFYSSNINQSIDEIELENLMRKNGLESNKFFLLVSGSRPHKNNCIAIETIDKMFAKGLIDDSYKVVVTGLNQAHRNYYEKKIKKIKQFVLLDYVDIHVLEGLYREEFALIYPSLYEGFGFPAVYAMKYGKNVLSTSWTSLPEVCKDAAFYFNPTNDEAIAVAIRQCLSNPKPADIISNRYKEIRKRQEIDKQKMIEEIVRFVSLQ